VLAGENASLKETNQKLQDEINRLQGEQGKPTFKENKKPEKPDPNHSSEDDRNKRKKKKKRKPKGKKTIDVNVDRRRKNWCSKKDRLVL